MGPIDELPDEATRLALLHELAIALSGEQDRRRVYDGIVHGARRLLGVPIALVAVVGPEGADLPVDAAAGVECHPLASSSALAALVVRAVRERRAVSTGSLLDAGGAYAATVAAPMSAGGRVFGVVVAAHTEPARQLHADDLRLLEMHARHSARVLANAETLAAVTRQLARAEDLQNGLRAVAEAGTRDLLVDRALDCATTALGADRAAVYLNDGGNDIALAAGRRLPRAALGELARAYSRSAGALLELMRAPLFIPDLSTDPRTRAEHETASREGLRSVLLAPLVHHGVLLGSLALYHDLVWPYHPEDVATVRALADQVALALANLSLSERTQRQLALLAALDALGGALAAEPLSAITRCRRGAQTIVAQGGATAAWIWLVDEAAPPVAHAGVSTLSDSVVVEAALRAMRERSAVTMKLGTETVIAAPLVHRDQVQGALALSPPRAAHAALRPGTVVVELVAKATPGPRLEFVSTAAGQLAAAVANARLYEQATGNEARLAAIIESMPDAVLVFDRDQKVVLFNRKVQEVYGLAGVDMRGWTPQVFIREVGPLFADPGVPTEIARRVSEGRDTASAIEFELARPQHRVIERTSAPVVVGSGEPYGQVILYHDLTALREAERAAALSLASDDRA